MARGKIGRVITLVGGRGVGRRRTEEIQFLKYPIISDQATNSCLVMLSLTQK